MDTKNCTVSKYPLKLFFNKYNSSFEIITVRFVFFLKRYKILKFEKSFNLKIYIKIALFFSFRELCTRGGQRKITYPN